MTNSAAQLKEEYDISEIIDGCEVMKYPPPVVAHRSIQGNLYVCIRNFLRGKRCKVFFETYVIFDEKNRFVPDVLVVCDRDKIKPGHIEGAPDFVAEVLSPSTRKYDIGAKKDVYEKYGVKEYWIIDPAAQTVDAYILREGKFVLDNSYHNWSEEDWERLDETDRAETRLTLKLSLYDDLEINVKELFE